MTATPASGANTWLTLNGKPVLFEEGTENLEAEAMEYKDNYLRTTPSAPRPLKIFIDQKELETEHHGFWEWRPRSYAGLYELRVKRNGYPDQVTKVRVIPRYFTQTLYQKMLDDVNSIATGLLFNLVSSVSERVESVQQLQDASPLQDYRHVRIIIDRLGDILSAIRRDPYRALTTKMEQQDWHDVWQFDSNSQAVGGDIIHIPRHINGKVRSLALPTRWQVPQAIPSYDVYENRLLKQFLQKQLIAKLNAIDERAKGEIQRRKTALAYKRQHKFRDAEDEQKAIAALERVVQECESMGKRCRQWSDEVFLRSVRGEVPGSKATQVLLKHPDYSRFYKLYLQFQQQLQISLNTKAYIAELSLRKMSELYEMWSVFELTRMAIDELKLRGYVQISQGLFYEVDKNSFHFEVHKNVPSIILARDDTRVKIIYEPVYPNYNITREERLVTTNGRSLPQTPDMSIEIYKHNKPQAVCIFDAKYKREQENGYFYPLGEDINKMHNYAANIQYQRYDVASRSFRIYNIVSSAYVLFPGNCVPQEAGGKIGGIPLRPNMSPKLQLEAREKLNALLSNAGI